MIQSEIALRSQLQGYRVWQGMTEKERNRGPNGNKAYKDIHSMPEWARLCAMGKPKRAQDFYRYMKEYCNFKG